MYEALRVNRGAKRFVNAERVEREPLHAKPAECCVRLHHLQFSLVVYQLEVQFRMRTTVCETCRMLRVSAPPPAV